MNDIRIYVPSKGRPKNQTAKLLEKIGIPATYVVEKEDYPAYRETLPDLFDITILPESNMGIGYSRNYIVNNSPERYIFQFDDDVHQLKLSTHRDHKTDYRIYTHLHPDKCIQIMYDCLKRYELGGIGCEHIKYSFSQKKSFAIKSMENVFLLDKDKLDGCNFDPCMKTKEDRDFSIQLLSRGVKFIVIYDVAKSIVQRNKKTRGGCSEMYNNGTFEKSAYILQNKWGPEIVKIVREKDGTIDDRINYKWFTGDDVLRQHWRGVLL